MTLKGSKIVNRQWYSVETVKLKGNRNNFDAEQETGFKKKGIKGSL